MGASGRLVLRNIFLDGHSIDKKPLVGDLVAGIGITWRGLKLTCSQVFRSCEFEGQPDGHHFGSVSVPDSF